MTTQADAYTIRAARFYAGPGEVPVPDDIPVFDAIEAAREFMGSEYEQGMVFTPPVFQSLWRAYTGETAFDIAIAGTVGIGTWLVAYTNDGSPPAGFAVLGSYPSGDQPDLRIRLQHLYVRPQHRRRGLARRLVETAVRCGAVLVEKPFTAESEPLIAQFPQLEPVWSPNWSSRW
jgi:ribosomal protein S18 acetylase RimI-like enzyme